MKNWQLNTLFLNRRWPWHLLFWLGYVIFRFWPYYITLHYNYPPVFLQYMLLSELIFVGFTYFTLWLYWRFFEKKIYSLYFLTGAITWIAYLVGRTIFQFWWLGNEPAFKNADFADFFFNNIAVVLLYFLFITSCKYFKDGYIRQYFDAEKKEQQLMAEVNNLRSQIAPHFLFNTLNNLYGLAVEKSDKLPNLMLRLSDLLRHSLYETKKPLVPINEELNTLKSYIQLESIRLENNLELEFDNTVPEGSPYQVTPLILIVFVENAFKHSRLVKSGAVNIDISTTLEGELFTLTIKNNYNPENAESGNGIGLANVKRRLEVLYPKHQLAIDRDGTFFKVTLQMRLVKGK
ncbi:MAG TPA: histidine kinase [Chitinophagaceae bacterium]|nr:histidine kinase [Chitinophagaceae bacterium]